MRLKEELIHYPGRTKYKMKNNIENFCALIIAIVADTVPEEAFLSLERDKVFRFIRHERYSTDDIYNMLQLRAEGKKLVEIAALYGITHKMVWQILRTYDVKKSVAELEAEKELERQQKFLLKGAV